MTLIAYRVSCAPVADLTDPTALDAAGIETADLGCPWEDLASRGLRPPSWRVADDPIDAAFRGALVPSFAPAPNPPPDAPVARNLVLWNWQAGPPCVVDVVDDFHRLPTDAASWPSASTR